MDQDRLTGAATEMGGKIKDAVGGLVGDTQTQADGKLDQVSGQLQNAYGSAKDMVRQEAGTLGNQLDGFLKDRPMLSLLAAAGFGFVLSKLTQSTRR